jgi:hypothetical protein
LKPSYLFYGIILFVDYIWIEHHTSNYTKNNVLPKLYPGISV